MENYIGSKFGKLTVLSEIDVNERKSRHRKVVCICECGKKTNSFLFSLREGRSKSCGCVAANKAKERWKNPTKKMIEVAKASGEKNKTHGMSKHPAFSQWTDMKARCTSESHKWYKEYGGRGVGVCDEWLSFECFWSDMGGEWSSGLQIDRIDNEKGYCKSNCKWSTRSQQQRNKRNTKYIETPNGVMDITSASEFYSVPAGCLRYRYNTGKRGNELIKKSQRG